MPDILNEFLKLIGGVAAIGAASSAFAYAMFRIFTTKWIETRFSERLEAFKHQQNQEIELTVVQKTEFRSESNKVQYYREVKTMHEAIDSYNQFHPLFSKNAIFIVEPIKTAFLALDQMLKEAIIERQVQLHKFDKGVTLNDKGKQLLKALEQGIQGRLWSSQDSKTEHQ
jgi:hypothetical protein